jgi:hypothetical protein
MYLRYSPPEFCEINITIRRLLLDTLGQQFVHSRYQAICDRSSARIAAKSRRGVSAMRVNGD